MLPLATGRVLLGTEKSGVLVYDGKHLTQFHPQLAKLHVTALAGDDSSIWVGTLGGLSLLDQGQARMNYTTANSGLKANWITALAHVGDEWFVGSYGGGIFRLDSTGRFERFSDATEAFVVNPHAMISTDRRVYAGTLERGLYVYDRSLERWSDVVAGLPSPNVTALAIHNGYLYIGTDNGLIRIPEQNLSDL